MNQHVVELEFAAGDELEVNEFTFGNFPVEDEVRTCLAGLSPPRCDGALVGVLWGLDEQGTPLVHFSGAPGSGALPARSVVPLNSQSVGSEVVLLCEDGDPTRPLIMGVLRPPRPEPVSTEMDGEKLVFTANREIVLRCGKSSITLTSAGKILIRGEYLLSRSAGVNRIKGGSVQIN